METLEHARHIAGHLSDICSKLGIPFIFKASYDKVEESLKTAGEKFKPFLSDLGDIQKALATDVTAGGVKAIKSTVSSANWNQQFVDKAVKSALKEMGKMEKALSSEAK